MVFYRLAVGYKQLACVALGKGVTGYALVGQGVVEIFYLNLAWIFHFTKFLAKLAKIHGNWLTLQVEIR